jgi:hypothetical protein
MKEDAKKQLEQEKKFIKRQNEMISNPNLKTRETKLIQTSTKKRITEQIHQC